jgi:glucose-6-phosphate 1-dehydrogenase
MAKPHSDALVIFGVTGDLAHKMIFPALYAMVKKGALKFPKVEHGAFAQACDGQHRAIGRNR